jgi:hypothetical protein
MSISMVRSDEDEVMKGYDTSISTTSNNIVGANSVITISSFFLVTPLPMPQAHLHQPAREAT